MKLFTKEIDQKLFAQYSKGSDLSNQMVVAKIFNPYGRGTWYLINSDVDDPDYLWAIVDLFEVEVGSVSRKELESIKIKPFNLGLERDLSFTPRNAEEVFKGLLSGKTYAKGGSVSKLLTFENNYFDQKMSYKATKDALIDDDEKVKGSLADALDKAIDAIGDNKAEVAVVNFTMRDNPQFSGDSWAVYDVAFVNVTRNGTVKVFEGDDYDKYEKITGEKFDFDDYIASVNYEKGGKLKYDPSRDVEAIVIQDGTFKLLFKKDDFIGGAYQMESGGVLKDYNYVSPRNIIFARLKSGEDIKPVNGFYIRKNASGTVMTDAASKPIAKANVKSLKISIPRPILLTGSPSKSPQMMKFIGTFSGKDLLRPAMTFVQIKEGSIVATDAYKLIRIIDGSTLKDDKLVCEAAKCKTEKPEDQKFPSVSQVINSIDSEFSESYDMVDLYESLMQVRNDDLKNKVSKTGRVIELKLENQTIYFDITLLLQCVKGCLLLGWKKAFISYSQGRKVIVFTEEKAEGRVYEVSLILLMPILGSDATEKVTITPKMLLEQGGIMANGGEVVIPTTYLDYNPDYLVGTNTMYEMFADGGMMAKGGYVDLQANLMKELHKLQRELNSPRLSQYTEGDNSQEEMARQRERASKLARFNEILELLRELESKKMADGGFVAIYNGKKINIEADSLYAAKLKAIEEFKVPKSKQGLLSVVSNKSLANQDFRFMANGGIMANGGEIPYTKNFLKGMQSIKVNGLGGYMPGVRNIYWDKKDEKFYFKDFSGDYIFELRNGTVLKEIDSLLKKSKIELERMADGGIMAKGGKIREFDDVLIISKNKLGMVEAIADNIYYITTPFGESFEAALDDLQKVKSFAQGGAMEHMVFLGDKVKSIYKNVLIVENIDGDLVTLDFRQEPIARRILVKRITGKNTLASAMELIDADPSFKGSVMAVGGSLQGHGFEVGDLIVEDLGGYIRVVSEDGKDFFITLRTGDRETEAPLPFNYGGKVKHSDVARLAIKTNEAGDEVVDLTEFYEGGGNVPKVFDVPPQFLDSEGKRKNDRKTIKELTDFVLQLPQTKEIYYNDELGDYTPSRKKLHAEIINKFKKEVVCINNDKPIAIFMGGSPASGKSSFLRKYSPFLLKEEILKIDADEIRAMLPEYEGWNACQTHLETKDIVNILLSNKNIGIPCDFDIIYDGTMNSVKSYIPLMDILKKRGYKIFIVFMDNVPKDVIIKRALDRYKKSGRFVPLEVIEDFFSKGKTAFNELKKDVDGYMLIDGSSEDYKVLEEGGMKLPRDREYSKLGTKIKASEIPVSYKKGGLSKLY